MFGRGVGFPSGKIKNCLCFYTFIKIFGFKCLILVLLGADYTTKVPVT